MLAWIEASVDSSGAPGAGGVVGGVPALAHAGAEEADPGGRPFSSSPCPSPAPQAASRSRAAAGPARKRLGNHLTRGQAGRANVLRGGLCDLPADLAAPVLIAVNVEIQIPRDQI